MMLKKSSLFFCLLIGMVSCYKYNRPDRPEHLIPKDEMANILIDLRLINAVTGLDKQVLDSAKVTADGYVYKKYDIDSTIFAENNAYYAYYVEDYEAIYALVKDSLDKLREHYDALVEAEEQEKKLQDSLKRIEAETILNEPKLVEEVLAKGEANIEKALIAPVSDSVAKPE